MSFNRPSKVLLPAAFAALALIPATAMAQEGGAVLSVLVECAKIDDPSARLACFDNNIRAAGGVARSTVPGRVPGVSGGGAPVVSSGNAAGFGGSDLRAARGFGQEDIRTPDRFQTPAGSQSTVATVASARMREPGIYLLTMQDDSQWQFAETVPNYFRVPRAGAQVTLERGALGSFLARIDGQEPVRVRRVR